MECATMNPPEGSEPRAPGSNSCSTGISAGVSSKQDPGDQRDEDERLLRALSLCPHPRHCGREQENPSPSLWHSHIHF